MADAARAPMIAALLRVPYQVVMNHVAQQLRAEFPDLRPAHLIVFQIIDHPPAGTRLTELAERAQMTPQSMGELIDVLEGHGYVERIPDPTDRRAKLIRYTEHGWAAYERGAESVAAIQASWAQVLGDEKFGHLVDLLRELHQQLQARREDG
jgi:DNA-binding MarR family transcriptional regulator